MKRIIWIERNTNREVLRTVKEKRTYIDAIRAWRWKMVVHAPKHPEELHNIIIKIAMVVQRTAKRHQ